MNSIKSIGWVFVAAALAAQGKPDAAPPLDPATAAVFARYDTDKDGVVIRTEFPGSDEQFRAMDRDANGKVTPAEFAASEVARRLRENRDREANEARPRADGDAETLRRLQQIARFDRSGDGRVTRDEWNGAPGAFDELDLDRNGMLDSRDRGIAEKQVVAQSVDPIAQQKSRLPSIEDVLKRFDTDKDGRLSRSELRNDRFAALVDVADTNRDGFVDREEWNRVATQIEALLSERERGTGRLRAPSIPFAAWDRNGDGRLEIDEWLEMKYLFARIDRDRDAAITKDEVARWKRAIEGEDFVERFDLNGDGRVTRDEFDGNDAAFARADRNRDGVVTSSDR